MVLGTRSGTRGEDRYFDVLATSGGSGLLVAFDGSEYQTSETRLFQNAEDRGPKGKDKYWGHGFMNAKCAVKPTQKGCPLRGSVNSRETFPHIMYFKAIGRPLAVLWLSCSPTSPGS